MGCCTNADMFKGTNADLFKGTNADLFKGTNADTVFKRTNTENLLSPFLLFKWTNADNFCPKRLAPTRSYGLTPTAFSVQVDQRRQLFFCIQGD
jgi:hypothetical protein